MVEICFLACSGSWFLWFSRVFALCALGFFEEGGSCDKLTNQENKRPGRFERAPDLLNHRHACAMTLLLMFIVPQKARRARLTKEGNAAPCSARSF